MNGEKNLSLDEKIAKALRDKHAVVKDELSSAQPLGLHNTLEYKHLPSTRNLSSWYTKRSSLIAVAASLLLIIALAIPALISLQRSQDTGVAGKGGKIIIVTTLNVDKGDQSKDTDPDDEQSDDKSDEDSVLGDSDKTDSTDTQSDDSKSTNTTQPKTTTPVTTTTQKPTQTTTTQPGATLPPITNFRVTGSRVEGNNTIVSLAWDKYTTWDTTLCFSVNNSSSCTHELYPGFWEQKDVWFANWDTGPHTITLYAFNANGDRSSTSTITWSF